MSKNIFTSFTVLGLLTLAMLVSPSEASAYIGPGPGLSFITTLIGFLVAIFTSLFVIIIYPIRKFLKRKKQTVKDPQPVVNQNVSEESTTSDKK